MGENDPNNPLSIYHLYITNEVKFVADGIVTPRDSPHEKTVKFMAYITDNFEFAPLGISGSAYPHRILEEKKGLCGDYAIMLSAFLATQGIKTRIIGIYNYANSAHAAVGVYYNDSWHMYDPTYNAYWVDANGDVLSFYDLQSGWVYNATVVMGDNTKYPFYLNPLVYTNTSPAGVIGPSYPMWWDLKIDGNGGTFVVPPKTEYRGGSDYIGASYINVFQRWVIENLTIGNEYSFIIYPKDIWGSGVFILHSNHGDVIEVARDNIHPIYINMTATNNSETLELYHDYRGYSDVLMLIEKYECVGL